MLGFPGFTELVKLADCLPLVIFSAFLLDLWLGDPRRWPHPVAGIGRVITCLEKPLNTGSPRKRRRRGVLLALLVVGGTYVFVWLVIWGASVLHAFFGFLVSVYFIFTSLAVKSLPEAGKEVWRSLIQGNIIEARKHLSQLVSRDTESLGEEEVVRGTVESLAENYVDGILSPLIFAALGGAPLAMAYKAVNTLDSMVGYRNERYRDFGWFSARLDDAVNYIPARLAVVFLLLTGWLKKMPVGKAFRIWCRDARRHPSPNSGNPESVVAGLLEVRLGGVNSYHGRPEYRAEMGDARYPLVPAHIEDCCKLIRGASWLSLVFVLLIAY